MLQAIGDMIRTQTCETLLHHQIGLQLVTSNFSHDLYLPAIWLLMKPCSSKLMTCCFFWTSAKVKTVNDDVRIQALVDGKKVIVNEASIRHDLRLDDAEGATCLPNDTIFEELEVNRHEVLGYIDSEDSTVMYTTVSSPYERRSGDVSPVVDGPPPVYPEYIPPEDDVFPAEEQPLPAAASPTAESPGYILESDLDEDPEEDPADYPADHDDEEEEEHPASIDSIPPPPALRVTARISFRPQPSTLYFSKDDAERFLAMPIPPPSPLTLLSSLLPQIPSPPLLASPPILPIPLPTASPPLQLLSSDRKADRPEAEIKRRITEDIGYGIRDTWIDPRDVAEEGRQTEIFQRVKALVDDSQYHYETGRLVDQEAIDQRIDAQDTLIATLTTQLSSLQGHLATALGEIQALQAKEQAHAARDANRTGDDSHTLGTGVRRTERWFERMETIFRISTCLAKNQVKFATCTLLAGALTWWNSHVRIVGTDAAYVMTWIELKKKMADKVERYIGGLPDSIYGSVVAPKPKTMQEATEMATGLMDKKIRTYAERQAANKRKFEDISRNNQGRQQPPKRQDVARAYAAGTGNRQQYAGSRPLCPKCNFNHKGPCIPRCYKCNKIGPLARDCRSPTNANVAN
nr:hypothetical protein [Tanacetum cinerariifolium]